MSKELQKSIREAPLETQISPSLSLHNVSVSWDHVGILNIFKKERGRGERGREKNEEEGKKKEEMMLFEREQRNLKREPNFVHTV